MAADELTTVLREIEDCRSTRRGPEIESFYLVTKKQRRELQFHSNCCRSFAKFDNYSPEHMLEAKKMMANRNYAWACAGKQLDAFETNDPVKAEFWRMCFLAFCYLWGDRKPSNLLEEHLITAARTYAFEARDLTDEEKEQLKCAIDPQRTRIDTDNDKLVDSAPDKEGRTARQSR